MKNYLLAILIGLSFSQAIHANSFFEDNNLFETCAYTFEVEAGALYLQPSGSNLHYAAEAEPLPLPTPNWRISDIKPDYQIAYDVGMIARDPNKNTRARIFYTNLRSKDSASKSVGTNNMIGPFFEIGPDAALYTNASGKVRFQYDSLRGDFGFLTVWNCHLKTHLFAGVEGVRISQKYRTNYRNDDDTVSRNIQVPTSFCGAGPHIGLDFSYPICNGLSFNGEGLTALLIGESKNHTTYRSFTPALADLGITPPNTQSTHVNDRTIVVPAFKCKLGLNYLFNFSCCTLDLDVGYEVRVYLNAIQSVDLGSEVVTPPVLPDTIGVYARTFQRNISNFTLSGPYIRLNIRY